MRPYVYHLIHESGAQYIGVKYGKDADPLTFWVSYFTSSKLVHTLIESHGKESFTFSIRKVFECGEQALAYETRLFRRINAASNPVFLNQHNNDNSNVMWTKEKRIASQAKKNIVITNGQDDKRWSDQDPIPEGWRRGRTKGGAFGKRSEEFREKMRSIKAGVPLSDEHKKSLKGIKRGMSGKTHSEETRKKISEARTGMKFSEEHRKNISLSHSGKSRGPCSEETRRRISEAKRKNK